MSFADLGLSRPILDAITAKGYDTPSPIQAEAIPAVIQGKDLMAAAQTGTGKTAGFTLPLLERLSGGTPSKGGQVRALILTPTRELAAQVAESVSDYSTNLPLRSAVVFGGVKINPQIAKLRGGVDILVATPGRLLDLYNQRVVKFSQLEVLVLDEADRMLDMGFIHDIKKILKVLPKQRQNLLFSATFSPQIRTLAKGLVNNPVEISVTPVNSTATTVKQWISPVDKGQKPAALIKLIKDNSWEQVLVFSRTKHGANRLAKQLTAAKITAAAIHGNKSQGARTKALADFKSGAVKVLVATDIAARGIDIDQLPYVVNFDLPNIPEDYVHRIGRTGRAGATGEAVSLVCADEFEHLAAVEYLTGKIIERVELEGFTPVHTLPASDLSRKPGKIKTKQRNQRSGHKDGQRSGDNARGHKPQGKNKSHRSASKSGGGSRAASGGNGSRTKKTSQSQNQSPASKPVRRVRKRPASKPS
ncbi:DEAD/DEAH box helicase [Neptuniibacter sp. UBA6509]|uniref:DEAD/DEAH box helicase n=2 Tax=unclassified Neptuniibacter TaxID=2630693 RepID=UPI000C455478|nr:DEAD/DEAH box helicase [Neptuniibacter sp. UBA6509]MAY43420.1 ATP-dependent RNA helicase [Oceanospirillaceae bacterium]